MKYPPMFSRAIEAAHKTMTVVVALAIPPLTTMAGDVSNNLGSTEINRSTKGTELSDLAAQLKTKFEQDEAAIANYLQANPDKRRIFDVNGVSYRIIRIGDDGQPVYQVNRSTGSRNVASALLIKADSLHPGGSVGANVTGLGMTVGVWEPGLPRTTHELLEGKVTIEAGQTNSPNDNHASHVTGTIVGKLLASGPGVSARGFAYEANARNWDSANDQSEMALAAAGGLLISNHSYGLSNDNTTPVWQFGAYDDEAAAWDRITKLAPYYLPFVAGGNEQQNNGNMSKNGYDLMTGSSASKNSMTVGALNADKTMSNYSNWGPTDDGRIKPEIVARGTGINSAQGSSDTAYSGTGEDSSGTSYAAPAAAGSALLLQQYFHKINNKYMRASTLKTLMLGTAEDLGQPGPDNKFGYGMLNVESAGRVIQRNSVVSGSSGNNLQVSRDNSRGSLIYEWEINPANDAVSELNLDLYAAGGQPLVVNLGWTDDEGPVQSSSHGVDPVDDRSVYNFDMLVTSISTSATYRPWVVPSLVNRTNDAVPASGWFVANGGPMRQVVVTSPDTGAHYRVSIRKSNTSPSPSRVLSLVVNGLVASSGTAQSKADCLFAWAEREYGDFFKPAGVASATLQNFYYRYYGSSNAALAVNSNDNGLYYLGPLTGNALTKLPGDLTTWFTQSSCQ